MQNEKLFGSMWVKPSLSFANNNCTEAAAVYGADGSLEHVLLRDDKQSKELGDSAPVMTFTGVEWGSLISQIKADRAKAAALAAGEEAVTYALDGGRTFAQVPNEDKGVSWGKSDTPDVIHTFSVADESAPGDVGEVGAFVLGAMGGEFDFPVREQQPLVT